MLQYTTRSNGRFEPFPLAMSAAYSYALATISPRTAYFASLAFGLTFVTSTVGVIAATVDVMRKTFSAEACMCPCCAAAAAAMDML